METSEDPGALVAQAQAALAQNDFKRAEELGRLVLRDNLEHLGALKVVALACEAVGRERSALLCFQRLSELDPLPENLEKVAQIYRKKGDVEKAAHYEKLILRHPETAQNVSPPELPSECPSSRIEAVFTDLRSQAESDDDAPSTLPFLSLFFKTLLIVILISILAMVIIQVFLP